MSTDVLEQAKFLLEGAQDCLDRIGDLDAGHRAQTAQAAALIAIAEQMSKHNDHLSDIRCHLDDLLTIFQNAEGPDGAIKVTQ